MKTVDVPPQATDVNVLLEQARHEDIVVRAADGTEFMLSAIDDFEHELARTRQNAKLMDLLEQRSKQTAAVSLDEAKRQLGLSS